MEENKEKEKIYYIPIEDIIPNRFQPRLAFDEKELNELANSIIKYGVIHEVGEYQDIQPLSDEDNKFINEQDQKQENQ